MRTGEAIREILQYTKVRISEVTNGIDSKEYYKTYYAINSNSIIDKEILDKLLNKLQMDYYDLYVILEGNEKNKINKFKEIRKRVFLDRHKN